MNVHDGIPVSGAHFEDQVISDDAGAVDQHCDWSKLGDGLLHRVTGGLFVGDIGADRDRTAPIFDDLFAVRSLPCSSRSTTPIDMPSAASR